MPRQPIAVADMTAPLAVFDLDGTLVDTAPDLVATLNTIFAREGLPPVAYEAARNMVGGGARALIERGLKAEGRALASEQVDHLVKDFITHYAEHIADRSQPFPGLTAALDALEAGGCRLAVCTNKLEWLSVRLLDRLGLSERFVAICGSDTFGLQKPNPELLQRTIVRCNGSAKSAVMIGDSISDIGMARSAGVPIVAVSYGYTEVPVGQLGPDRVVGALSELPQAVFELMGTATALRAEQG
jgi:phosphoglycolate phosphatase